MDARSQDPSEEALCNFITLATLLVESIGDLSYDECMLVWEYLLPVVSHYVAAPREAQETSNFDATQATPSVWRDDTENLSFGANSSYGWGRARSWHPSVSPFPIWVRDEARSRASSPESNHIEDLVSKQKYEWKWAGGDRCLTVWNKSTKGFDMVLSGPKQRSLGVNLKDYGNFAIFNDELVGFCRDREGVKLDIISLHLTTYRLLKRSVATDPSSSLIYDGAAVWLSRYGQLESVYNVITDKWLSIHPSLRNIQKWETRRVAKTLGSIVNEKGLFIMDSVRNTVCPVLINSRLISGSLSYQSAGRFKIDGAECMMYIKPVFAHDRPKQIYYFEL